MINVGILIFGDPTRGGTITSEVKFIKNLYEKNSKDCNFFILTVNETITKKIIKNADTVYDFPHKIIKLFNEADFGILQKMSCIVTYPGHSNFFGGYLNDNIVKMYQIISKCTNELKIPVFVRINDSEIKVRDYRLLSKQRLDSGYAARLEGKPDSAFMKDPLNVEKAEKLVAWKQWDYSKVFWFANGSKEICDWVSETMYDREDEYFRMTDKETFIKNTVYVSDDIFFLVKKNYRRFKDKYEQYSNVTGGGLDIGGNLEIFENYYIKQNYKEEFCYIGFFDTVNIHRGKAFNTLFKENREKIPVHIFGKGTEFLGKLRLKENIQIEEGFIKGDSDEYFDFLNKHIAYIFIGKGNSESRYIGKTVYDAIVARTPIVVYRKCDNKQITFSNNEFYFENEAELKQIFEKLKNNETRNRWIEEQRNEIFSKLPKKDFQFSEFAITNSEILEEECYKLGNTKPITISSIKSTSLF